MEPVWKKRLEKCEKSLGKNVKRSKDRVWEKYGKSAEKVLKNVAKSVEIGILKSVEKVLEKYGKGLQ